jgi:SAM-dependent methyltransferase
LAYPTGAFAAVVSNSIIHHIPDPFDCFSEMVRVCRSSGVIFVRDLIRPATEAELHHLVSLYAGNANLHQRQLFADSLRAALTLAEVQSLVVQLGFESDTVSQTSDRHWTWATAYD